MRISIVEVLIGLAAGMLAQVVIELVSGVPFATRVAVVASVAVLAFVVVGILRRDRPKKGKADELRPGRTILSGNRTLGWLQISGADINEGVEGETLSRNMGCLGLMIKGVTIGGQRGAGQ